jgi:hypothetical protein
MTPGLLRPLAKSADQRSNKPPQVQHHFSWLHKKQHYSPTAQQQLQLQQYQQKQQLLLQQQQQQLEQLKRQQQVPPPQLSFGGRATSGGGRKAMTLGGWGTNRLPGRALLFEKLAKLKKKNGQGPILRNSVSAEKFSRHIFALVKHHNF